MTSKRCACWRVALAERDAADAERRPSCLRHITLAWYERTMSANTTSICPSARAWKSIASRPVHFPERPPAAFDDGLTGFIVENEEGAIGAFDRLSQLSREKIRRHFEQRFTARRMALEYLAAYRSLMDRAVHRFKLVVDGAPAI